MVVTTISNVLHLITNRHNVNVKQIVFSLNIIGLYPMKINRKLIHATTNGKLTF